MRKPRLTRKRLLKAADYMDEHGLAKHNFCTETGEVCALGAIAAVVIGDPAGGWELADQAFALFSKTGAPGELAVWNDRKSRTKAQVVAKLREMAELASAR